MTDSIAPKDTLISKHENREMFDTIAHRYDLMNRIISLGMDTRWRKRAIAELCLSSEGRYLDVGSGTGDLALDILEWAPDASVLGLDPATRMLALGRDKIAKQRRMGSIRFVAGDAMFLPFSSDSFDGVILGFCIRNVENRMAAVREFHRVLKPGGRLVILELTVPPHPLGAFGHRIYTGLVIPLVSYLLTRKGAYDYLVKSVRAFPRAADFLESMMSCGFCRGRAIPLMMGSVTIFVCEKQLGTSQSLI